MKVFSRMPACSQGGILAFIEVVFIFPLPFHGFFRGESSFCLKILPGETGNTSECREMDITCRE